jgi:hypothetical protein
MNSTLSPRQTVSVLPVTVTFQAEFAAAWAPVLVSAVEQTTSTPDSSLHKQVKNGFERLYGMAPSREVDGEGRPGETG